MAISKELPGVIAKSTSCSTVPLKAASAGTDGRVTRTIYVLLSVLHGITAEPANRTGSVTSSVATLTDTWRIADTPEGTTKLELRLEARFALRLLYESLIVAPVAVLIMVRDAIVFTS